MFHLVSIEGKDYGYFDPNKVGHPAVFAFYNPDIANGNPFTLQTWDAAHICEYHDSYLVTTSQRLGKKFYWARTGDDTIKGIKRIDYNEIDRGYRLRLDINNRGDSRVSEEVTGSIRFMDSEKDRVIMYFITFSDDEDDPRDMNRNYRVMIKNGLSRM
ncbi:hypothetical protein RMATCC62417_18466 [Rhizopus microsporus]|nr:hypothetical protein RMATCC62417_18466 [Rhizopus microsporus]